MLLIVGGVSGQVDIVARPSQHVGAEGGSIGVVGCFVGIDVSTVTISATEQEVVLSYHQECGYCINSLVFSFKFLTLTI